ncbi:DNA recombination protein RmuC [Oceanicella actignis]|uniref:DNA recombination protein RmuC homolog n=1 Tax=Oceanicella actignis TaxID=1189325 RepID=A0A1M7TP28_9RHOB|nr:DNA recombination protein RmuC [Oceanicella actignis]SET73353.1 DNA recombination protein RmuC [Oceanicella actignis]SHN72501.1 DNA recombination protein RmuC [Oceanicella actignis]
MQEVLVLVTILALLGLLAALFWARGRANEPGELRARLGQLEAAHEVAQAELRRLAQAETEAAELRERLSESRAEAAAAAAAVERLTEERARAEADQAQRRAELAERLAAAETRVDELRAELEAARRELAAQRAAAEQERLAAQEKLTLLQQARDAMTKEFKLLAEQVVRAQGEDLTRAHQERLEAVLAPLRQNLGAFEKQLREAHGDAAKERAALAAEIRSLTARSEKVSKEAENLARALKGDNRAAGAWGEMVLSSLLERSGLREGEEYLLQPGHRDDEGRALRPDVVVLLPGDRRLVIDSKVSLLAYERAMSAEDEAERKKALDAHAASIRRHVDLLSSKEYHALDDGAANYVVMFMPVEGALAEALRARPDLTAYAAEKHVMIATPTTLMMTLRTVENVWQAERRNRNADEIARRAGLLYDKLAGFVEDLKKVGAHLDKAQAAHGQALDKLARGRGNALGQIDKLKELGARTQKSLGLDYDELPDALPGRPAAGALPPASEPSAEAEEGAAPGAARARG